jgi:hypothetical protein
LQCGEVVAHLTDDNDVPYPHVQVDPRGDAEHDHGTGCPTGQEPRGVECCKIGIYLAVEPAEVSALPGAVFPN